MSGRLALGTVQFGLRYGIANRSGQVSREAASAILAYAARAGMTTLDTAMSYGESETRLGQIGVAGWQVVSKLPPLPHGCADVGTHVGLQTQEALRRLRIPRLYGLLLHRPQDLLEHNGPALYAALGELRARGTVHKVGVSLYDPRELEALTSRFRLDIVQAPFSVMDRRLATTGWLERLHAAGTEVHVRSLFLQGLLLMPEAARPRYFDRWQPLFREWQGWLEANALTPLRACVAFALSHAEVDRVIVGVDSLEQLQAVVAEASTAPVTVPKHLRSEDSALVNPSQWNLS